jgi:hypothetical protein
VSFCWVSFLTTRFSDFGRPLSCSSTCYQVKPSLITPASEGPGFGKPFPCSFRCQHGQRSLKNPLQGFGKTFHRSFADPGVPIATEHKTTSFQGGRSGERSFRRTTGPCKASFIVQTLRLRPRLSDPAPEGQSAAIQRDLPDLPRRSRESLATLVGWASGWPVAISFRMATAPGVPMCSSSTMARTARFHFFLGLSNE